MYPKEKTKKRICPRLQTRRAKCPRRKKSVRYTCIFLSLTTTETTTFTTTECILCSLLYSRVCFEPRKKSICFEPRGIMSKPPSTAAVGILVSTMGLGIVNAANAPLTDSTFSSAITSCLAEDPVGGICPVYGTSSGFGEMSDWDVSQVTSMSQTFMNS